MSIILLITRSISYFFFFFLFNAEAIKGWFSTTVHLHLQQPLVLSLHDSNKLHRLMVLHVLFIDYTSLAIIFIQRTTTTAPHRLYSTSTIRCTSSNSTLLFLDILVVLLLAPQLSYRDIISLASSHALHALNMLIRILFQVQPSPLLFSYDF